MNNAAIDQGSEAMISVKVPDVWGVAEDGVIETQELSSKKIPSYISDFLVPVNRQDGDKLPVSVMLPMVDGTYPPGTSAYERRGVAINVPEWISDNCIQCNQCSFVCPHATIRPFLVNEKECNQAPEGFDTKPANGTKGLNYRLGISPNDCTGCGNCVNVCPAKEKALVMKPLASQQSQEVLWDYALSLSEKENPTNMFTVKGSQFAEPYLEFSGACAGCLQTGYAKLVTQLYGDRLQIANSAGCSHVWAASVPANPYTTNKHGRGPAWCCSLFEDTAELGLGMLLGVKQLRKQMASKIVQALQLDISEELRAACNHWLIGRDESDGTRLRADQLIEALEPIKNRNPLLEDIYENRDFLVKRSQWLFGGDGWAYDIGFGGLDHVLASGENVNVLVLDTEVYSNTGGQSSKATPTAAIAKFAASGKKTGKKDLGQIAMTYGYIYVAQIAMGADKNQTLKAIAEAEAYPGPSLVIAYSPCINHGLQLGMSNSQLESKRAVDSGYWALYRYNPELKGTGMNPFILDSKEPTMNFREFLMGEVRFSSLIKKFPNEAEELFAKTEYEAKNRLETYRRMAVSNPSEIDQDESLCSTQAIK